MEDWRDLPDMTGRHVRLQAMRREDREPLLEAFAGLEDIFTTVVPSASTIDAWMDTLLRERDAGRSFPYTVFDAEGQVSGTTRYMRMSQPHRRLEIGGTIYARRVQRTGLNTEAKLLLLTHAFEALDCNVVQLRTDWLNSRSRAAIERLGARLDGVLRAHLIMPDGHPRLRRLLGHGARMAWRTREPSLAHAGLTCSSGTVRVGCLELEKAPHTHRGNSVHHSPLPPR